METVERGSRERSPPRPLPSSASRWSGRTAPAPRTWLALLDDEVESRILKQLAPRLVVWSSLWSDHPRDRVRFDLCADGAGTVLRWTLTTAADPPSASEHGHMHRRLNVLVNERLRSSCGQ